MCRWGCTLECYLTRNAQDWELDEIAGFLSFLYSVKIDANGRDRLLWKHSGSNKVSVKSFYKVLSAQQHVFFPVEEHLEGLCAV